MNLKEDFLRKSKLIHGNRYDYSLVEYKSNKTNIKIICSIHGEFEQTPDKHINRKQGCPKCSSTYKLTINDFLKKANKIHNNLFDYSLVEYINIKTKVKIICKEHGIFEQVPDSHLGGAGCPKCMGRDKNIEKIKEEFHEIHGEKYDYSLVKYVSEKLPIQIICPLHGIFEQTYNTHKKGHGCAKCAGKDVTTEEFVEKVKIIHNNKYDYSFVDYKNNTSKVKIICPIHGEFQQAPANHLTGNGCLKCRGSKKRKTTEEFIEETKLIHGERYDYSLVEYVGCKDYIKIICKEHGIFNQWPDAHLQGFGCPRCGSQYNDAEDSLKDFISSLGIEVTANIRKIISPLELDIYIPSHNLAIEFNGLYWHNELNKPSDYHLNKTKLCLDKGIKLIHVFEDEWNYNRETVKSRLKNLLGLTENKIYARKCEIKNVLAGESKNFLNNSHLQGNTNSSIRLGLYYQDELVSLMTFNKPRLGIGKSFDGYELTRFCNKLNTSVIGGADKLLKYFITNYQPKCIVSYADRRWSQGDLYEKLGFELTKINKPNYWYIKQDKRKHRFGFRKHILKKEGFDIENKTEHQIMIERKIFRIYDCGTLTYKKTLSY